MWFSTHRLDIGYGLTLAEPAFELPTIGQKVFETFYKTLSPRFSINLSDLQTTAAKTYEDFSYVINLFGGSGTLNIKTQGLSATFERLSSAEHLKLVSDCVTLCEEALWTVLPDAELKSRKFTVLSWLKCEGGAQAVHELLQRHGSQGVPIAPGDFTIENVRYRLGADFTTMSEGWGGGMTIETSVLDEADLYYRLEIAYLDTSHYSGLEPQIEHARELYLDILARFGLEPAETTEDHGPE